MYIGYTCISVHVVQQGSLSVRSNSETRLPRPFQGIRYLTLRRLLPIFSCIITYPRPLFVCIPSRGSLLLGCLCSLLGCQLCLHLPPGRQDHLISPPLQRCLPLVPVRAPPLALLVLCSASCCCSFLRTQFATQVVSRDQIRLCRLLWLSGRGC